MSDRGSIGLVQPLDLQRSSRPWWEPWLIAILFIINIGLGLLDTYLGP